MGDNEEKKVIYRKGVEVIKTTLELEKGLHKEIELDRLKKRMSLRDYMSVAARRMLSGSPSHPDLIDYNKTASKIAKALSEEFPKPFDRYVLAAACAEAKLDITNLEPKHLGGPLRKNILKYVDYYSGSAAVEHMDEILKKMF